MQKTPIAIKKYLFLLALLFPAYFGYTQGHSGGHRAPVQCITEHHWDGYYKVRNGSFWHVHNPVGEMISNIWGDIVDLMEDGLFRCYRAGIYHYYDIYGNEHLL